MKHKLRQLVREKITGKVRSKLRPDLIPLHWNELLLALGLSADERYEKITIDSNGGVINIQAPTNKTETVIEDGVGINNEQYQLVKNDVWLDIKLDLTKDVEEQDEEIIKQIIEVLS
jgi:hypothetical protein